MYRPHLSNYMEIIALGEIIVKGHSCVLTEKRQIGGLENSKDKASPR
jgi:hypothetical protein